MGKNGKVDAKAAVAARRAIAVILALMAAQACEAALSPADSTPPLQRLPADEQAMLAPHLEGLAPCPAELTWTPPPVGRVTIGLVETEPYDFKIITQIVAVQDYLVRTQTDIRFDEIDVTQEFGEWDGLLGEVQTRFAGRGRRFEAISEKNWRDIGAGLLTKTHSSAQANVQFQGAGGPIDPQFGTVDWAFFRLGCGAIVSKDGATTHEVVFLFYREEFKPDQPRNNRKFIAIDYARGLIVRNVSFNKNGQIANITNLQSWTDPS